MTSLLDGRTKAPTRRKTLRVLIVDRSVEDIRALRDLLQGDVDLRVHAARDSVEALTALKAALHLAATALSLTTDVVDQCLDVLENAGVDLRFPLSFARPDED